MTDRPMSLAGALRRRRFLTLAAGAMAGLPATRATAQGFAGLGTEAEGFSVPERGYAFDFPADHGAHPTFRIEWWYITANLRTAAGEECGIQWTLFRSALAPEAGTGWSAPQIWMGHAGMTLPDAHFAAERFARGGIGTAGVQPAPFSAWIDEWEMTDPADGSPPPADALDRARLHAAAPDFSYTLTLEAEGPLVFHGEAGYSVKSHEGQASHYYSQPFYRASGVLRTETQALEVSGRAWLDREWSSQPLAETQDGWDWISLHFDSGAKLMGFRLRDRAGPDFTAATWIDPDGSTRSLPDGALTLTPLETTDVAGRDVPTAWWVGLPLRGVEVRLTALNRQAWMGLNLASYWEGPVLIDGTHQGRGYLEMTGYPVRG